MVASEYAGLHVAVIGVGGWGKNHARVLNNLGALSSCLRHGRQRGTEISEKYNANCYTSLDQLLQKEQIWMHASYAPLLRVIISSQVE